MIDKKRLFAAGFAVTMSIMMATPALAAPNTSNRGKLRNDKANTVIKKSKAKVGALTQEEKDLLMSLFDAEFYAKMYPEAVKVAGNDATKLFEYFIRNGLSEGQQINADFNVNAYRSAYSDLNSKYGTSILSYYKHYVTEGKAEGRTITTVEKAQEQGIIVTDFGGNKMAVDESGSIVAGEAAEKIILTDKAYANAVDNIVAAELGVSPAQAFLLQKTEFIENIAAVEGQMVADIVSQVASQNAVEASRPVAYEPEGQIETPSTPVVTYNETAYQAAMTKWRKNEPKKEDYSASYDAIKAEWQSEKPVRANYNIATRYTTKAQAEAAYNSDYTNWANSEPNAYDYMTSAEKTNFENAKSNWENAKPQRDNYIVTLYDTKANAEAAYQADYTEWESKAPKRSDYVVGNYPTKELARVEFENDLLKWETNEPKLTDAKYSVGNYKTTELAHSAYETDLATWEANKPKITDAKYSVGYESDEAAQAAFDNDLAEYEAIKPNENDAKYSVGNYKTIAEAEAQCEIDHENFVNEKGQKPTENDDKYSVGYDSEATAQVQFDGDRATYERENPAPVESDYTYGGYTDENAATQAYENAVESYISGTPEPKISDYNTESVAQYNAAYSEWSAGEPSMSDYTYPTAELEAQADANYNAAISEWENSKPSFDGNLSESENASYEEAHDYWEESEPNHNDFRVI